MDRIIAWLEDEAEDKPGSIMADRLLEARDDIVRLRAALRLIVNVRTGADDDAHVMKEIAMKALGLRDSEN